jgi:hypothetical protein
MKTPAVFWMNDHEWREAHMALDTLFSKYDRDLEPVRRAAKGTLDHLEQLFPVFDEFSGRVCPECRINCCLSARVGFDLADLIFMHALAFVPPGHQLRGTYDETCRYLGNRGCVLSRKQRPFVCTWYYCAPMLDLFYQLPVRRQRHLTALMKNAQENRRDMEARFIRITSGTHVPEVHLI